MNDVKKNSTKQSIMDVAEAAIIQGGYNAFSFRDVAEQVGIKSASVHYHYPTKGDLVADILLRYKEDFEKQLPKPTEHDAQRFLNGYIDGFKMKIVDNSNMSLCTMLTADKNSLPESVTQVLVDFYQVSLNWLTEVCIEIDQSTTQEAEKKARQILASLHGASLLVLATGNNDIYEDVVSAWR